MNSIIRVIDLWKNYNRSGQENMAALRALRTVEPAARLEERFALNPIRFMGFA